MTQRELACLVVISSCTVCVAQGPSPLELAQRVASSYKTQAPYRMQVRTFTLKPGVPHLHAASLNEEVIGSSLGNEIESREAVVYPGGGVLLDWTPEEVRRAKGRQYLALWNGRRYYECVRGAPAPADLTDKDTGGVFISPANYVPTSIPDEIESLIEAGRGVTLNLLPEGSAELSFDRATYRIRLSDACVLAIEERLGGGKRAVKTYVGIADVKLCGAPFPRYMVTSIFSGQSAEPDFQSVIMYETPVVDRNMKPTELHWWQYRDAAVDVNTKQRYGKGDVRIESPPTPDPHRRRSQAVLDPKVLAASATDPDTIVLPSAERGLRTILLGLGCACLAGAVALLVRKVARGSVK